MLYIYTAQQCFDLSDEGLEDASQDNRAIQGIFCIDLTPKSAPDTTTILRFRRLIEKPILTHVSPTKPTDI
jgi:IS5 family transposase